MRSQIFKMAGLALVGLLGLASALSAKQQKQKQPKHEKTVWNYDGGVFFQTDGTLPNGVCFRIAGRMSSQDFFFNLKRVDSEEGTNFLRGPETVIHFPDSVTVSFSIRDEFCPPGVQQVGTHVYMTEKMINDLRLSIYWKHGVDLRPVRDVTKVRSGVERINPYATALAGELPARYEWWYELAVPSAGVSLSDSLAFVFRTPDGRIAARVAARL